VSDTPAPATPRRDRFPLLLGAAVALILLLVGAAGLRSWADLAAQRAREAELERETARTEVRVRQLEERIRRLQDDPHTLERLARQDLGLVRPEDLVFVFPEPPPPPPSPAPPSGPPAARDGAAPVAPPTEGPLRR
jgi:cell division protein FtsB